MINTDPGKVLSEQLNSSSRTERLAAASAIGDMIKSGKLSNGQTDEVNNHIHTIYSFSPYSPSKAAFMAWASGLKAAGSVDHDSIGAAAEMVEACKSIGIGSTTGFELRVNFSGTSLETRKINNPDTINSAYICIHGVPHGRFAEVAEFIKPIRDERNIRNRTEVEKLNSILPQGVFETLDFEKDVLAISESADGGGVTERHILYALSHKIIEAAGKGEGTVDLVTDKLGIPLTDKIKGFLLDTENPHYVYDLLGILKSNLVPSFFIQPNEVECPAADKVVAFANSINAIPSYAYLGDVAESPTGDKKAEKFEDDYLDELFEILKKTGFKAVTYMPPRNTVKQLLRVQALCDKHAFMQISGVDINSSRQVFRCPEILQPEFTHLIDATWTLIAHEHLASADESYALFNPQGKFASKPLSERMKLYAEAGKKMDLFNPENIIDLIGA